MLVTEQKALDEIVEALEGAEKIVLVGCQGCPQGWESGGPEKVAELADKLAERGKTIVGTVMIDFLCNKALVGMRLSRRI